ncbi:MAG: CBS domain-containing protein [Dehalococcoidia bacterium]|nr:CBS domain-containing protein [Dehalococcoidia bacterium]
MTLEQTNILICPSCGAENIEGTDTCENCLMDLRTADLPKTKQLASTSDFLEPIGALRLRPVMTTTPDASVESVVATLRTDSSGAVVILENERIIGIFTERDVLKKVAGYPDRLQHPVSEYMTPDPVVLRDEDTMATALNKMGDGGFRHIPYVREGKLVGMLTGREVMNWLMSKYFD